MDWLRFVVSHEKGILSVWMLTMVSLQEYRGLWAGSILWCLMKRGYSRSGCYDVSLQEYRELWGWLRFVVSHEKGILSVWMLTTSHCRSTVDCGLAVYGDLIGADTLGLVGFPLVCYDSSLEGDKHLVWLLIVIS